MTNRKMYTFITFSMLLFSLVSFASQQRSNQPDHITLTWSASPATTQTITWRTDSTIADGVVQYSLFADAIHLGESKYTHILQSKSEVLITEKKQKMYIHSVVIEGLTPDTKYSYRVGTVNNFSPIHTFSTEPSTSKPFSFLLFGDSQSGDTIPNYVPWHNTITNAYSNNKDAKFIINMGDMVEYGQVYIHWNNWFDAAKGVIENIPEMPVEGNHETYSSNNKGKPESFISQFKLPQNGPETLKNQVYSYDYSNVHFVVIDSQFDEEKSVANFIDIQKEWIEKDLASTQKEWKIVLFHKSIYYNSNNRANELLKNAFTPLFDKYHVDLVFNAHDHSFSRTFPIKNDKYVSKPSEGTVYYITGRSGNKSYPQFTPKVWDAFFYNPKDQPCFELVTVNNNILNIKAFNLDNTLIDSYTIDKGNNTDIPQTIIPSRYDSTKLVIYGQLVNSLSAVEQQNGKWYIPLNTFITNSGGTFTCTDKVISIVLNGKTYSLGKNLLKNGKSIVADDIKSIFAYSFKYDESMNVLYFTK